jgi:phage protein D
MGLSIKPQFRVTANGRDITRIITERLKHLRLIDETGNTADTLEICLSDHDPSARVMLPPTGAELEVSFGYDGAALRMGLFVCDEIQLAGPPDEVTILARAAPFERSSRGRLDIQSQRSRSWAAGTKIGDMVRRIAGEHRLKPRVSEGLAAIQLPHIDQASESDMNLLLRIAKRYDAIAKPAGGFLLFIRRGDAQSASGAVLPRITLTPEDGGNYRVTIASRDSPGTVVAFYRDIDLAERHQVTVGKGEPVKRLRMQYKDRASAEAAALAELRRRARRERTLSYSFPGRPDVVAECVIEMQGFREGIAGRWLVTRAEHYIGPDGYRCSIEAEQPNSIDSVALVNAATISDVEDTATLIED